MPIGIEIITTKNSTLIRQWDNLVSPEQFLSNCLHSSYNQGWHFGAGDPEFWRFADKLIIPNGVALDLGTGFGRTCLPFALRGMRVVGYENNPIALHSMRTLASAYNLPFEMREDDITQADLGQEIYDTAILGQTLTHFPSKVSALATVRKAIAATKIGGRIYLRASSKETSEFQALEMASRSDPDVTKIDRDVFMGPCDCSGEYRIDPYLFLDPMELMNFFIRNNTEIEYAQVAPLYQSANIMYGEDWIKHTDPEENYGRQVFITIMAKKLHP